MTGWLGIACTVALVAAVAAVAGVAALRCRRRKAVAHAERERLLGIMDLAALLVRDLDGTIRYWSEGCERLYGWSAAEAVGRRAYDLLQTVPPEPWSEIEAILRRDGEWTGNLRQRTRDGAEVIILARKVLRRDLHGQPLAVIDSSLTDITPLVRAEAALRESRERLSVLIETAADGIVVARSDGRIVSVNSACVHMFGYHRPEELVDSDLGVLMPADETARHRGYLAAHRTGAPPHVIGVPGRKLLARRRDGSTFPIDLSVSSFGEDEARLLTGIIRDASAHRAAEQALRDSAVRLRLVQQVGGIASGDRIASEQLSRVSKEFAVIYGLPVGQREVTRQEWFDLIHPDDRPRVAAATEGIATREGVLAMEFRIRRPDGVVRWIAARAESFPTTDGTNRRVISAHQDITELVAAREVLAARGQELERLVVERTAALAEAEARFRAIFDSQFQFIGLLSPDGTLLEANRTALEVGCVAHADMIGRPFWEVEFWPQAERDRLRREIAAAAQGTLIRREMDIVGADGRAILIDFSLKPVRDAATGAVTWIIPEGRDITEQRRLANQLAQAQKVHALGQLAGGIAHDFNNILQAVSGAAMLIERQASGDERIQRLSRTAIDAAARGASITRRLLSFARRGELHVEPLPTAELLNNVREVLAHALGTTITVRTVLPAVLPPLLSDRGQLETALVNLGTNARDAMPNGGTLTLSAEAVRVPEGAAHTAGPRPGDYVRIDVVDTGSGMDAATLARASEPFFTTKPEGQGTGLGLAMVKEFAEQSGGALSIESTPGLGTTIQLWVRQAKEDAMRFPAEETGHPEDATARVLVVDDDDLVREMLAEQLEMMGFAVTVASSGTEAVALIEAGEAPDVLVSDLSMGGMNGIETIRRARELRPRMPCFLLTGYAGERAALDAGDAFTLVRKPVSARALATRIEAGLEAARR